MASTDTPRLDITATPAHGQNIFHEGREYTTIKEGLAHILVPATSARVPQNAPKGDNEAQSVFYNPIQQFNRDLSVLAIKAYGEEVVEKKRKAVERRGNGVRKQQSKAQNKKRKRESEALNTTSSRETEKSDDNAEERLQGNQNGRRKGEPALFAGELEANPVVDVQEDVIMQDDEKSADVLNALKQKRENELARLRQKLDSVTAATKF